MVNNKRNLAVISKNKTNGNENITEIKDEYATCSFANYSNLFIISKTYDSEDSENNGMSKKCNLYVYDNSLNRVKTISLGKYSIMRVSKIGDKYYFASNEGSNEEKDVLYILNEKTLELEEIEVKTKNIVDVMIDGDNYIFGSSDFLSPYNGGITFKNISSGEEIFHELKIGPSRMFKVGKYLYAYFNDLDNVPAKLMKFEVNGTEIKVVKEANVKIDEVRNDKEFVTGMFLFEKK